MRSMRILIALATVGAFFAVAGNAFAAQQDNQSATSSTVVAYSDIVTQVTDVVQINAASSGALQLRAVMPNGSSEQQKGCKWVNGGINSFVDSTGRLVKVPWHQRTKVCRSKSSPSGWRKRGPKDCWNPFWLPRQHPKNVFHGKFVVVENFTWDVTVKAQIAATASVWASCSSGGASAWALAYAYGFGSIDVHFTATVRSKQEAMVTVGSNIVISASDKETLKGKALADAKIHLVASARVSCSGQTPAPSVTPPGGPTPPPPVIPPKDSTQTPINPPGSGGQPGVGQGPMCRDITGNFVPGTPDPVTQNCPGVIYNGTTGGPGPAAGPPAPASGQCVDPVTLQPRAMAPGESKDQFGYCI